MDNFIHDLVRPLPDHFGDSLPVVKIASGGEIKGERFTVDDWPVLCKTEFLAKLLLRDEVKNYPKTLYWHPQHSIIISEVQVTVADKGQTHRMMGRRYTASCVFYTEK